jgi:hypothetical protein
MSIITHVGISYRELHVLGSQGTSATRAIYQEFHLKRPTILMSTTVIDNTQDGR